MDLSPTSLNDQFYSVHYEDPLEGYCCKKVEVAPTQNLYEVLKEKFPDTQQEPITFCQLGKDIYLLSKAQLSKQSEALCERFTLIMESGGCPVVEFQDDDIKYFGIFMRCLQEKTADTYLNEENAPALLTLANKYGVNWLQDKCIDTLRKNLNNEKAKELVVLADQLHLHDFMASCVFELMHTGKKIHVIIDIANKVGNKKLFVENYHLHFENGINEIFQNRINEIKSLDIVEIEKIEEFTRKIKCRDLCLQIEYLKKFNTVISGCSVTNGTVKFKLKDSMDISKFKDLLKFKPEELAGIVLTLDLKYSGLLNQIIDNETAVNITGLNFFLTEENGKDLHLLALCENLKSLRVCGTEFKFNPDDTSFFKLIPKSVSVLGFQRCRGLSNNHIACLAHCKDLEGISFIDCENINITSFEGLPKSVKTLSFMQCRLNNNFITSLTNLPLEELNISYNRAIDGSTFKGLPKSLKVLICSSCNLCKNHLPELAHLENLKVLNILCNGGIDGTTFDKLPDSLEELICEFDKLTIDVTTLKNFKNLKNCIIKDR